MKKLILNAADVCILKNDADFFGTFGKIIINTAGVTFSSEAYTELSKQGLIVNAANINIVDIIGEPVDIGDAVIDGGADYSGKYLVGGNIRITDKDALGGVTGIHAHSIIAPEGMRFDFKVSGKVRNYPEGAVILEDGAELSESYVSKLADNAVLWTLGAVDALDDNAVAAISARGITVSCGHLLITESAEQRYGKCFRADIHEVIPDGCQYVKGDITMNAINAELYDNKLYISGDLMVKAEAAEAFARRDKVIVTGCAIIPYDALPRWKEIGRAKKVIPYKGELWTINGKVAITHEQLEAANADGLRYTLISNGVLEFDDDVTKANLDCFLAFYYNGVVRLPAKVIPAFNSKVVESNGMVTPIRLPENVGDFVGDIVGRLTGSGDSGDVVQTINVASFVRV